VHGAVETSIGKLNARDPADREQEDEADRPSMGVLNEIEPPHIVAIQENTFTPVGTAITIVAKVK
jgi:hypothetical protein